MMAAQIAITTDSVLSTAQYRLERFSFKERNASGQQGAATQARVSSDTT